MINITLFLDEHVHIPAVVRLVYTKVLCARRVPDQNGQNQGRHIPLVVLVGTRHMNRQRRASLVDQDVDLAAKVSAIRRILSGISATQRSRTAAAVDRLPHPTNVASAIIVSQHRSQNVLKDSLLRPGLKPLMDHTAAHAEPPFSIAFTGSRSTARTRSR